MKVDLDRIAFIGRTYREYKAMFDLDEGTMRENRVLDCPGGASSFTLEAVRRGYDVRACDILYGIPHAMLIEKACTDTAYALEQAAKVKDLFNWGFYGSPEKHAQERMAALKAFSDDFPTGVKSGRYVAGMLPGLPFRDKEFSLVLSSHLLFLYGERLDFDMHMRYLRELARVGKEVRVFPVIGLDGEPYKLLDEMIRGLKTFGIRARTAPVFFEFMKGAKLMLWLSGML